MWSLCSQGRGTATGASLLTAMTVLLGMVVVSCNGSEDRRDDGIPAQRATVMLTVEPSPTPPLLPQVSIEYGGNVYWEFPIGYSWPMSYGHEQLIAEPLLKESSDNEPSLLVKRGDDLLVVVSSDDPSQFEVWVMLSPVLETGRFLQLGEAVYSSFAGKGITLDFPPDVYVLSAHYESQLGYVSYDFKVEVVN